MRNLNAGDEGTLVQYLQLALNRAGYPNKIDGVFGDETCEALRVFQRGEGGCEVNNRVWQRLLPYIKGYQTHVIKRGDTLWKIAAEYNSTLPLIMAANPMVSPTNLEVGMPVRVPLQMKITPTDVPYSSLLLEWVIDGLMARYPFVEQGNIGDSVMGKEIPYLKIGNGDKQVFYNASFHANEWINTPMLLKFVEEYAQAFATNRDLYGVNARRLFREYELYLVPMVNPDGVDLVNGMLDSEKYYQQAVAIARNYPQISFPSGWKANIDGVDLNLQYPAGWEQARETKFQQGYTSPAPRDFVGTAPLTAPESRAVYEFTKYHDFQLILAYHTQGEVIYWKYLNYNPKNALEIGEYFSKVSGYALEETPTESAYAGYKDWFIMTYNRPGYTIETGMGESPLPLSQFDRIYQDNHEILLGGMTQI